MRLADRHHGGNAPACARLFELDNLASVLFQPNRVLQSDLDLNDSACAPIAFPHQAQRSPGSSCSAPGGSGRPASRRSYAVADSASWWPGVTRRFEHHDKANPRGDECPSHCIHQSPPEWLCCLVSTSVESPYLTTGAISTRLASCFQTGFEWPGFQAAADGRASPLCRKIILYFGRVCLYSCVPQASFRHLSSQAGRYAGSLTSGKHRSSFGCIDSELMLH